MPIQRLIQYVIEFGRIHPAEPDTHPVGVLRVTGVLKHDRQWETTRFHCDPDASGISKSYDEHDIYETFEEAMIAYKEHAQHLIDDFQNRIDRLRDAMDVRP